MVDKWQTLLKQLEILESSEGVEIWSQQKLQAFEAETGILLPIGYQEFCQVLGTGMFGNYIRIYCPHLKLSNFAHKLT